MGKKKSAFLWTDVAVPALVLIILVSVVVIQYDWFRRSAAVEVKTAQNSLAGTVFQFISREYQRYASLSEELKKTQGLDRSTIKQFLETQVSLWSSREDVSGVIIKVGWQDFLSGKSVWIFSPLLKKWTEEEYLLPPQFMKTAKPGELFFFNPPADSHSLTILFLTNDNLLLFIEIDEKLFFDHFIKPAVLQALPGYSLEWTQSPPTPPEAGDHFDPIAALWGSKKLQTRIPLPPLIETFQPPRFFQDHNLPSPGFMGMPGFHEEGFGGPRDIHRPILQISFPEGSGVFEIERRLAWLWWFTILLLVLVGTVILVSFHQAIRLRSLATKEREFVAGVTHELRTPLTVIQSAADNLLKGIVHGEKIQVYGHTIHDQALRLGRMIEEILLFAQVESRAVSLPVFQDFTPASVVEGLKSSLELVASEQGKTLKWLNDEIYGRLCRLDRDGFELILKNLVMNAIVHAYENEGEIRVFLSACKAGKSDGLMLCVEDDGRGIAFKDHKAVFEPFYRDEVSRNRQERGSGLGLFLVMKKVQAMGGTLKLESPYKRDKESRRSGCRFVIKFPVQGQVERNEENTHY